MTALARHEGASTPTKLSVGVIDLFTIKKVSAAGSGFCDLQPNLCSYAESFLDSVKSLMPNYCKSGSDLEPCNEFKGFGGGGSGGGGGAGRSWGDGACFDENWNEISCLKKASKQRMIFTRNTSGGLPEGSDGTSVSLSSVASCVNEYDHAVGCDVEGDGPYGRRSDGSLFATGVVISGRCHNGEGGWAPNGSPGTSKCVIKTGQKLPWYTIDHNFRLMTPGSDKPIEKEGFTNGYPDDKTPPVYKPWGDNPWGNDGNNGLPNWDNPEHPDYNPNEGIPPGNPGTFPNYPLEEYPEQPDEEPDEEDGNNGLTCNICNKVSELIAAVKSIDKKFATALTKMDKIISEITGIGKIIEKIDLPEIEFDSDGNPIKKTSIWDFLTSFFGDIFDLVEFLIEKVIELVVPKDSEFITRNITMIVETFNTKMQPVNLIKTSIVDSVSVEQKEFKDIEVSLPAFGTVKFLDTQFLTQAVPTFRNLVSGFLILVTAIWAFRKISSGVVR